MHIHLTDLHSKIQIHACNDLERNCDPPPTWQRSQTPPRLKKSKRESLPGSLRGSWPTAPQNESKMSLLETLRVKNHLFLTYPKNLLRLFFRNNLAR